MAANLASPDGTEHGGVATMVTTAPAAQFLGSFAADSRKDDRKPSPKQDIKSRVKHYFAEGWDDIGIWKSALMELIGTMNLCYVSALIHITIGSFNTTQVAGYAGISNIFLLALFIYALSAASGGHINPMITFATMITSLTGFSRGFLYLVGQTLGASIGGGLIRGSFGKELTQQYGGGGCYFEQSALSDGQIFLIEAMSSFVMIFLAFGVGLDPRQGILFGPKLGPFLTACALGLMTFASVGLAPGFPGVGMNPARCFSFAVARGDFQHQWIWWVGPLAGSLLHAIVYHIAPPYHHEKRYE